MTHLLRNSEHNYEISCHLGLIDVYFFLFADTIVKTRRTIQPMVRAAAAKTAIRASVIFVSKIIERSTCLSGLVNRLPHSTQISPPRRGPRSAHCSTFPTRARFGRNTRTCRQQGSDHSRHHHRRLPPRQEIRHKILHHLISPTGDLAQNIPCRGFLPTLTNQIPHSQTLCLSYRESEVIILPPLPLLTPTERP